MCVWRGTLWDGVSDGVGRSYCPPATALSDLHLLPSAWSRQCHKQPRPRSPPVSMLVCRLCPLERSQELSISSVLHSWLQDLQHTCVGVAKALQGSSVALQRCRGRGEPSSWDSPAATGGHCYSRRDQAGWRSPVPGAGLLQELQCKSYGD